MKINPKKLVIVAILFSLSFIFINKTFKDQVLAQLKLFYTDYPIEKVYVQTDKPYYTLGETIWFKGYLVDGITHQSIAPSKNFYVELIDPDKKVVQRRALQNKFNGVAGDFLTDENWQPGTYLIRGYSKYMQNFPEYFFFQKEVFLWDKYQDTTKIEESLSPSSTIPEFEVQFFPEGGDMIERISSKIGFKAVGKDGNGILIEGKILDQMGTVITYFKSIKFGLGFFSLKPEPGKKYLAEIVHNGITKAFLLPTVKPQGYTLKTRIGRDQKLKITLASNQSNGLQGTLLHGHVRGLSFLATETVTTDAQIVYEVGTDSLPSGIAHLTLFNKGGSPVCERLVFISNASQQVDVDIQADAEKYKPRSKVDVSIQLTPTANQDDLEADLVVSVVDKNLVQSQINGLDIRSYLLLSSEIKGRIEQPGYFLNNKNKGNKLLLDLLMMIQGWRRFEWQAILDDQFPEIKYIPEQGFNISGKVTKIENNNRPIEAQVYLNTLGNFMMTGEILTKEDGLFNFSGLALEDTTTVILQANQYKEKAQKRKSKEEKKDGPRGNRYVAIQMNEFQAPEVHDNWTIPVELDQNETESFDEYLQIHRNISKIDSSYRQFTVDLDEVTIQAKRKRTRGQFYQAEQLYSNPSSRLVIDSMGPMPVFNSVYDLIRGRVPGVTIEGIYPNQRASIRGNEATILVDGFPMEATIVNSIPVANVAYIDVLKSAGQVAIFGTQGANGVIAIYTRLASTSDDAYTRPRVGVVNFEHPGYYKARQFYCPTYDTKLPEHAKPDFRTTLHWDPNLRTDKNGKTTISFYTDDKVSVYSMEIQGITIEGTPVKGVAEFEVEN